MGFRFRPWWEPAIGVSACQQLRWRSSKKRKHDGPKSRGALGGHFGKAAKRGDCHDEPAALGHDGCTALPENLKHAWGNRKRKYAAGGRLCTSSSSSWSKVARHEQNGKALLGAVSKARACRISYTTTAHTPWSETLDTCALIRLSSSRVGNGRSWRFRLDKVDNVGKMQDRLPKATFGPSRDAGCIT